MLVDVHTHLTHPKFQGDVDDVIRRAEATGLDAIIVNGLHPESNRQILTLAKKYTIIKAALGIYPIEAINQMNPDLPFPTSNFDPEDEVKFIESEVKKGGITAIGECGLDGYWVGEETFKLQEKIFEQLITVAKTYDLPLIIHTRKLEKRSMEILKHHNVSKVNFHCYGGKVKLAIKGANEEGWYFSIPANARKNEAFTKMLSSLPLNRILTETDAPYLAPSKGERNEPKNVAITIDYLAQIRGIPLQEATEAVKQNYKNLFEGD